ncbi:MAG: AAA family ATPase, partial [Actinomycetes bacterium]
MIEYLQLHNLGLIRDAQVDLGPGLTVLTGETGAGKTMVLTALNLLLGGKSESGLAAAADTRVHGSWILPDGHPIIERVKEAGGVVDDGELVLTRTLPADGRSRCSAGGVGVPQSLLAQWGEQLVAVHGQSDQLSLRRESAQRAVLDRYAGPKLAAALQTYSEAYRRVLELDESVATAAASREAMLDERARLIRGLEDIEALAPVPAEDEQLAERAIRLGNLEELSDAARGALAAVLGDGDDDGDSISGMAARARRALASAAGLDPELAELATRLDEVMILANEVGMDLSRYLADLDPSPGELEVVQSRRAELTALTRLYGPTLA